MLVRLLEFVVPILIVVVFICDVFVPACRGTRLFPGLRSIFSRRAPDRRIEQLDRKLDEIEDERAIDKKFAEIDRRLAEIQRTKEPGAREGDPEQPTVKPVPDRQVKRPPEGKTRKGGTR